MITVKAYSAILGFAFVAAWIEFNFGYAVLCLVGAAVFYAAASFYEGDIDVGDIQSRLGVNRAAEPQPRPATAPPPPPPTRAPAPPRPAGPRVQ
jgi:hypothetical protein